MSKASAPDKEEAPEGPISFELPEVCVCVCFRKRIYDGTGVS